MDFLRRHLYRKEREKTEEYDKRVNKDTEHTVKVDALASKPYKAWRKIKPECVVERVKFLPPDTPVSENSVRFVCVADTHVRLEGCTEKLEDKIPPGDVLLHAGDFSMYGTEGELSFFNSSFGVLEHKVKILIAGNHDMTLDPLAHSEEEAQHHRSLLTNFIYLEDAMLNVCGIKVYGSPWVPVCGSWGFTLQRGAPLLRRWNLIPDDVDILMTHGPPLGYGDTCFDGYPVGCVDLLNTVRHRVKPKYHVFGHIHEGHGMYTNGETTFINAAICTKRYKPIYEPIVFDYPLPAGHTKKELRDVMSSRKQFHVREDDTVMDEDGRVHKAADFMKYDQEYLEIEEEIDEQEDDGIEFSEGKGFIG